jgi:hypothetical protein
MVPSWMKWFVVWLFVLLLVLIFAPVPYDGIAFIVFFVSVGFFLFRPRRRVR